MVEFEALPQLPPFEVLAKHLCCFRAWPVAKLSQGNLDPRSKLQQPCPIEPWLYYYSPPVGIGVAEAQHATGLANTSTKGHTLREPT